MNHEEPFLTDPKQMNAWLASVGVKNWTINVEGLVDVEGSVYLGGRLGPLTKLPVRFGKVYGDFSCDYNRLISLEGVPKLVSGSFLCNNNQLVSLEGAPKKVGGDFHCRSNHLASLEGAPKEVGGGFLCKYNQLVSLGGAPNKVGGDFSCYNNQLVSLEGAPNKVGGNLWCEQNLLVDFKGLEAVSIAGDLVVADSAEPGQDNVFVSLEGLPKELYSRVKGLDVKALMALEAQHSSVLDIEI